MGEAFAPRREPNANVRGALYMAASALTFTAMTTLVKYLGAGYSAPLQAFYRQSAGLLIMLPLIIAHRKTVFLTRRPIALASRSLLIVAAMTTSFFAYQHLPLANANALSFSRTLWLAPLAAILLKERLGVVRIGAVLCGFAGVLIMIGPLSSAQDRLGVAAAILGALLFALSITGMKFMTRDHDPFNLLAWGAVYGFLFTLPGAWFGWRWPTALDTLLLFGMGGLGILNQSLYINGMRLGDALAMAPIDYIRLVFALLAGVALFGEIPSPLMIVGALVVVASSLAITVWEARGRRIATGSSD